jgi:hypothetical protein
MKFDVTMKDPDTLHDAIREAVEKQIKEAGITDEDEIEVLADARHKKISELCSTWFQYGEYLTVEIDTDAKTCVVCPIR